MPKKSKLKLEDLNVKSFKTLNTDTVKGGATYFFCKPTDGGCNLSQYPKGSCQSYGYTDCNNCDSPSWVSCEGKDKTEQ